MKKHSVLDATSVILAGILWGILSLFVRHLDGAGYNPLQICFIRALLAALILGSFLAVKSPEKLRLKSWKHLWYFLGTGTISLTLFNFLYFTCMTGSQASIAVVLLYTSPVFVTLMSALLFGEKITGTKIIALFMTLLGCVLVSGVVGSSYSLPPLICLCGIGSGFFYALYSVFGRYALRDYDPLTVTFYTFVFGAVSALPLCQVGDLARITAASPKVLIWCLLISVCSTILPYFFYTYGLQRMDAGKAAILVTIEPLVGALLGILGYHEPAGVMKLTGMAAILAAVLLLQKPEGKRGQS